MKTTTELARAITPRLLEAIADSPVVLIHGPRQCGKTTLARLVGDARGYHYVSFDDDSARAAALADPAGFVQDLPERVVLDEVQRTPGLFAAIKLSVDRDRRAGRFILTGSSNILLLPRLADSLAGRMEILRLHPLSQAELAGNSTAFLDRLMREDFRSSSAKRMGRALAERIVSGGYPAALARASAQRRALWYRDYVTTLVQRDMRDLGRINSLDALPRLLAAAASQSARLINVANLAAPFQLSRPTIRHYLTLLGQIFLVDELPPWHNNRLSRLVKTAKLHLGDSGVAAALLGVDGDALWADRELYGQLLETFVFQELRRQASAITQDIGFHHLRDKDGVEVDIVLEAAGRRIFGIEVKAAATVTDSDFRGLRKLQAALGKRFVSGIVLYDGEQALSFGESMRALPMAALWS